MLGQTAVLKDPAMTKIRAAICREFAAPLSIEEIEMRPPLATEVEVTLEASAICHSDISYADGAWGGQLPAVYGHEAAGRITTIGADVAGYSVGDTVIVTLIRSCGHCTSCTTGTPTLCFTPRPDPDGPLSQDGTPILQAMHAGAFAEKVVVHHSQIAAIPADMPMEAAALLSCGVITGVGAAVNTAGLRAGQTCVVIGAGGVGLNAIQGARIAGASRVVAIDMVPEKLDMARDFGATDTVLATDPKPWRQVHKITRGGADAVLVCVGAIPAYDTATKYLRPGGKVVMVGMPHTGATSTYEPVMVAATGQGMLGTKMGDVVLSRDIPWLVDLYQQGRLKLDELISGRWRLDQINEAIADTKTGGAKRNVILFD